MECNSSDLAGPTARRTQQRDRRKCGQPTTKKRNNSGQDHPKQTTAEGSQPEQPTTGRRPVPVPYRRAKTAFPGAQGPLRCAAWPFPAQNPKELDCAVPRPPAGPRSGLAWAATGFSPEPGRRAVRPVVGGAAVLSALPLFSGAVLRVAWVAVSIWQVRRDLWDQLVIDMSG